MRRAKGSRYLLVLEDLRQRPGAAAGMFQEALNGDLKAKWVKVWAYINRGKIFDIRGQRERATTEYQKAVNTGDDSYGAKAEADKYVKEPFRRAGKTTIG